MTINKKSADLLKKHQGSKEHALITVCEIIRIATKLKNEYLLIYYKQIKAEIEIS